MNTRLGIYETIFFEFQYHFHILHYMNTNNNLLNPLWASVLPVVTSSAITRKKQRMGHFLSFLQLLPTQNLSLLVFRIYVRALYILNKYSTLGLHPPHMFPELYHLNISGDCNRQQSTIQIMLNLMFSGYYCLDMAWMCLPKICVLENWLLVC